MSSGAAPKRATAGRKAGIPPLPAESAFYEALARVEHPELEGYNLVELGMIPAVLAEGTRVRVSLALPFPNVPIKEELVRQIHQAVEPLAAGAEVEVETVAMDEERRREFLELARRRRHVPSSQSRIKHVLAVLSGKGGVGKSSVAGLLAGALQRRGLKAGVLDADITGPSMPKLLGVTEPPAGGREGILPPETSTGIKVISINLMLQSEDQPVIWRGPMVGKVIEQFWQDVTWGELDYLIVDLPPGTSDAPLTVMQSLPVDGVILVTSPQDLAGMVVRKAANMARQLAVPLLGLVENMSYVECPECGARIEPFGPSCAEATARHAGVDLLGRIPLDPQLAVMCDEGKIEEYPESDFAGVVDEVLRLTAREAKQDSTQC